MIETVGIVGGGQLGRMLTEAAHPLGFKVVVVDPALNCPAAQVGAEQIHGGLQDAEALGQLAMKSDVITWEIEHINSEYLSALAEYQHTDVQPSPTMLGRINNKYLQKKMLQDKGLPVPQFVYVPKANKKFIDATKEMIGADFILKSAVGGYDGRNNLVYDGQSEEYIHEKLGDEIYAEELIDFDTELSVVAARDIQGNINLYPTVETIHEDNICHTVASPAEISPQVDQRAGFIADETLNVLRGAGVFAIEMFVTKDQRVLINEIAPRVHNSGHLTIEANVTSQFEQHIRAITGLPLGSTARRSNAAVMINILGSRDEALSREGLQEVLALPDTHVHFYGKTPKKARKIGHITVLADSTAEAMNRAINARSLLAI